MFQSVTIIHFLVAFCCFFCLKLSLCRHISPNRITTEG